MTLLMLCMFQVVQEYERAVIFRLGRLLPVGAKGPGNIQVAVLSQRGRAMRCFVSVSS